MIMGLAPGCRWLLSLQNCVSTKSACLDLYDTPLLHVTGGVWIVSGRISLFVQFASPITLDSCTISRFEACQSL